MNKVANITHNEGFTEFERRGRLVAPYFNHRLRYDKDIIPPPVVHEFLGHPNSGKSTIADALDKFWKRLQFRTYAPQEGADAIRYLPRDTYFYNISTGLYAFDILMRVTEGHQYDFTFFDRCVFDTYTWMKYWHKKGQITKDMMQKLQDSFLVGASRVDFACIVYCEPNIAMERDRKHGTTSREGKTANVDTIKFLIDCNLESFEELNKHFPQLTVFDTSELGEAEMVQHITDLSIAAVERRVLARERI
ncbi:MAG: hypothetical protein HYT37_03555 [Candidatus Sungbacteria bacterium]|nr:hypothetical protein [Candidatus Sungbacteria bacterium]